MNNPRLLPYLLIFAAGVLWGGTFSLALVATAKGAHPLTLTTWQVFLTAVITVVVCLFNNVTPFRWRHIKSYLVIGLVGVIVPDILYYNAAPHLSAGILSITVSTVPLFTYLIMWLMGFEPIAVKRAFGIVLGMTAILLLVLPDQGLTKTDANFWTLWVVVCAVLYSVENVYISEAIGERMSIFEILSGSTIVSTVFLIPATMWIGATEEISWVLTSSAWAITAIAAISVVAYAMFFYTIRIAGPVFASQCAYIVTIAGVIWGITIFSEQHSLWVWASVIVLLTGIALVSPTHREAA